MTALFRPDGERATKANVDKTDSTIDMVTIDEDLYERASYGRPSGDANPAGDKLTLFCRAGMKMRESEFDALFPAATVASIVPATGDAAGGTVVLINGTNLDGVTGVTFGGTAGTSFSVLSNKQVRVTTPAKTAGEYNVVLADDSGATTVTNGYEYT